MVEFFFCMYVSCVCVCVCVNLYEFRFNCSLKFFISRSLVLKKQNTFPTVRLVQRTILSTQSHPQHLDGMVVLAKRLPTEVSQRMRHHRRMHRTLLQWTAWQAQMKKTTNRLFDRRLSGCFLYDFFFFITFISFFIFFSFHIFGSVLVFDLKEICLQFNYLVSNRTLKSLRLNFIYCQIRSKSYLLVLCIIFWYRFGISFF